MALVDKLKYLLLESSIINWQDMLHGGLQEILEIVMDATKETLVLHNYWYHYCSHKPRKDVMHYILEEGTKTHYYHTCF